MIVLELEKHLPVPPAEAFALVSDPALMNRWSEARIEPIAAGDAGHVAGVGAIRRVHARIAGRPNVLDEVIERVDPPHELRYRVFAPATVRHHQGVITIAPTAMGSRLRWRVEIELVAAPLEWLAGGALRPALERSLDVMAAVAEQGVPQVALPEARVLDEPDVVRRVRPLAEACLASQRARADALLGRGDDRGWFARVYQHVTEGQLEACDARRFDHPAWVLQLVVAFHALWERNLAQRLGEEPGEVEPHWARAHRVAERGAQSGESVFVRSMRAIHAGMRAHIEDDLPRAIAKVHLDAYVGRVDPERFRADYLRMGDIFLEAGARIRAVLPRDAWTVRARLIDALTPEALRGPIMDRTFYPIARQRRRAFERAVGLVRVFG